VTQISKKRDAPSLERLPSRDAGNSNAIYTLEHETFSFNNTLIEK